LAGDLFVYSGFTPLTALRVLADFLADHTEGLSLLESNLEIAFLQQGNTLEEIVLIVRGLQADDPQVDYFNAKHNGLTGRTRETQYNYPQKRHPLLPFLPNLVIASTRRTESTNPNIVSDEVMLWGVALTDEQAAAIDKRLRLHATSVRVARADAGAAGNYFFHIKDDKARLASFSSAAEAGDFDELIRLDIYRSSEWQILLPHGLRIDFKITDAYVRLLHMYLNAIKRPIPEDGVLAAVAPSTIEPDAEHNLLFLGELTFLPIEQIFGTFRAQEIVQVPLADGQQALQSLGQQLRDPSLRAGHSLRLRRAAHLSASPEDYEALKADIQYMQMELEEMEGMLEAQNPRLLRFEQHQLGKMANLLASYDRDSRERIRYTFFAGDKAHRQGVHYLYVPPEAVLDGGDLLFMETIEDRQKMEYWLDPLWRTQYAPQVNRTSRVFVPYGMRLYPSLHSWDVNEIDHYLAMVFDNRGDFTRWNQQVGNRSERIYVFEPVESDTLQVRVSVLDWRKFAPINSPDIIGWINDNLSLIQYMDVKDYISTMATEVNRLSRLEAVRREQVEIRQAIEKTENALRTRLEQAVNRIYDEITTEIDKIISNSQQDLAKLADLQTELEEYRVLYHVVKMTRKELAAQVNTASRHANSLNTQMVNLAESIQVAIETAKQRQEEFIIRKMQALHDLSDTRDQLHSDVLRAQKEVSHREQIFLKQKQKQLGAQQQTRERLYAQLKQARDQAHQDLEAFVKLKQQELDAYEKQRNKLFAQLTAIYDRVMKDQSAFVERKQQEIRQRQQHIINLNAQLKELQSRL
jgi:hypothetical protein